MKVEMIMPQVGESIAGTPNKPTPILIGFLIVIVLIVTNLSHAQQPAPKQKDFSPGELYRKGRLARQSESNGELDKALELWQYVIKQKPSDYSAYHGIVRCLTELERYEEVLVFLDESMTNSVKGLNSLDPVSIRADKIGVMFSAGLKDDAQTEILALLDKYRGDPKVYQEAANVLFTARLSDQALSIFHRGREECHNPYLYARDIARWSEAQMNWNTAVVEYVNYLRENPSRLAFVTGAIADLRVDLGADSVAIAVIQDEISTSEKSFVPTLQQLLASLHFRARRYNLALEQYKKLDSLNVGQGRELIDFAQLLMDEEEFDLAFDAYENIIAVSPAGKFYPQAMLGKGLAAEALGEVDSAAVAYSKILKQNVPYHVAFEAYSHLGRIEQRRGAEPKRVRDLMDEAIKIAQKARLPLDKVQRLKVDWALTWAREGNLERSEKVLKSLMRDRAEKAKSSANVRFALAKLAFWQGDMENVTAEAGRILAEEPSSEHANDALNLIALVGDLKNDTENLALLGKSEYLVFLGQTDLAVELLDSLAGTEEPRVAEEALWRLYDLEFARGSYQQALSAVNRIVEFGESGFRTDLALITAGDICLNNLNDAHRAQQYYETLLVDYPDSPLSEQARRKIRGLVKDPS